MPTSLLDSQLTTLEPPALDEACVTVDASLPPAETVAQACDELTASGGTDGLTSFC